MAWVSNWIQGIIVAVIISTIIEMILPEGNCKKYIKIVIGVYILFSIVSPVINKFTGNTLIVTNIFDLNEYMQVSSNNNKQNLNSTKEQQIRNIYEENLKSDIKAKIKSKGYDVNNISLDIENNNQYTLRTINITLKNSNPSNINTNNIQVVNEIKIEIENSESNNQKETNTESTVSISSKEKNALKQYLSGIYEIEEKNIIIN